MREFPLIESSDDLPIAYYATMRAIAFDMAEAAKTKDWKLLGKLEATVAFQGKDMMYNLSPDFMTPEMRSWRAALIKEILDDDREVRKHTNTWADALSFFLGLGFQNERPRNPDKY